FFKLLGTRRSIRSFTDKPVSDYHLERILEACDMAPSSGGLQTFEVYQVKGRETKKKLASAARDQESVAEAPLLLVFCANPTRSSARFGKRSELFSVQDATIATAYSQLAAVAMGLSCVWVGAFDEKTVSDILDLPAGLRPVSMLPVGYQNEKPEEKKTRGAKDLLHTVD
ncbi:MAG TPA: nitroreductase family protein, partial [Candidatus Nitrosotalea sp.]|nr:nitroreductase family protein [Candidatus Nitrosotalea sp.]